MKTNKRMFFKRAGLGLSVLFLPLKAFAAPPAPVSSTELVSELVNVSIGSFDGLCYKANLNTQVRSWHFNYTTKTVRPLCRKVKLKNVSFSDGWRLELGRVTLSDFQVKGELEAYI